MNLCHFGVPGSVLILWITTGAATDLRNQWIRELLLMLRRIHQTVRTTMPQNSG